MVNDYVVPSIAVVQVTDSPFLGVVADIGIENPHHLVFIRKGIVSFDLSPESLPVLIHRLEFDLVSVQRRAFRDIVDEKTACSLCSLAGKPYVSLINTLRRCIRANRDTVNLRRNQKVFLDFSKLPFVIQIMLVDVDTVKPVPNREPSCDGTCSSLLRRISIRWCLRV